jgi:hypothetical protein
MGFASYLETISERLNETRNSFHEEIGAFRTRLAVSDLSDRESVGADITAFKMRLTHFLDELESRSKRLFVEAAEKLRDRDVNLVALMNKREGQLADAREKRNDAIAKRDRTREVNAKLIDERDKAIKECKRLELENAQLKRKISEKDDWTAETKSIKRRSS